jgi:uncharacterized protein (TIGR03083 family)
VRPATVARMTADVDHLDYLDHLARESARFAAALRDSPPDARVPTCPDWNADDLLWHLAEVQWFWGTIVREKVTETERANQLDAPTRPDDRAGLFAFYDQASSDLGSTLTGTPPDMTAWTWADEQTAGFIRRRQAHEALIHRIDAELTAGARTAMDTALSSDGVDEVLRVMYGGAPPWGEFRPDNASTVRVRATDTGDSWFLTLGQFTGTDPDDGVHHDGPDLRVAGTDPGSTAAAELTGSAADLDCWLWHRPALGEVLRTGDEQVLTAFDTAIAPGIN